MKTRTISLAVLASLLVSSVAFAECSGDAPSPIAPIVAVENAFEKAPPRPSGERDPMVYAPLRARQALVRANTIAAAGRELACWTSKAPTSLVPQRTRQRAADPRWNEAQMEDVFLGALIVNDSAATSLRAANPQMEPWIAPLLADKSLEMRFRTAYYQAWGIDEGAWTKDAPAATPLDCMVNVASGEGWRRHVLP